MAIDPNEPLQPSLETLLPVLLQPAISGAVASATAGFESRISAVEATVATAAIAQVPQLISGVTAAGDAVLVNLEKDPITQRYIVWGVVGAALVMAIVIAVAAMLGNSTANRWILSSPGLIVGAVLWVSNSGATATHKVVPVTPISTP